jgi:transposase
MSVATAMVLRSGDEPRLSSLVRSTTVEADMAQKGADRAAGRSGVPNTAIAAAVGVSRPTVILWRNRHAEAGIAGLEDLHRSGRPAVNDDLEVVVATLAGPPEHLGVTNWSARLLANELGISFAGSGAT